MGLTVVDVSGAPDLEGYETADDRIEAMVEWFTNNFEDPAESLPYESAEGGYQWIWGGPYEAAEQLSEAFPDADEDEIEAAVDEIEKDGIVDWTPISHRIQDDGRDDPNQLSLFDAVEGASARELPPAYDAHRFAMVETVLFPQRSFRWSLHVTFVPIKTNGDISLVSGVAQTLGADSQETLFHSLRDITSQLLNQQWTSARGDDDSGLAQSISWVDGLSDDSQLLVDDGVIVHNSPPEWLSLKTLFGHGAAVSGIVAYSGQPSQMPLVVVMYCGSLLVLRLARNLNFVQDAFFERWAERIKKDNNNPF